MQKIIKKILTKLLYPTWELAEMQNLAQMLIRYDIDNKIKTSSELKIVLNRIIELLPKELKLKINNEEGMIYLKLIKKKEEDKLVDFYSNWYFYQEYKDNPHYTNPFYIKYE